MKDFESSLVSLWPKFQAGVFLKVKIARCTSRRRPRTSRRDFPGTPADFYGCSCKMVSIWEMMRKVLRPVQTVVGSCREFDCDKFLSALVMWPVGMLQVTRVTLMLRRAVTGATAGRLRRISENMKDINNTLNTLGRVCDTYLLSCCLPTFNNSTF